MAENFQRFLLWLLAIGLIVGTALALRYAVGYRYVAGLGTPPPSLPPNVYLRLTGIKVTGHKDGKPAWYVTADRIDTTKNKDKVDFVGNIKAELLQSGQPRATFTAEKATYNEPTKMLIAEGKPGQNLAVIVRGANPRPDTALTLSTDTIQWNIGSRQILCPNAVNLTVKDLTLNGVQLRVDLNTREYSIQKWSGTFLIEDESSPVTGLETLKEMVE
jgi:lipopolysaccharide export system protein LptC